MSALLLSVCKTTALSFAPVAHPFLELLGGNPGEACATLDARVGGSRTSSSSFFFPSFLMFAMISSLSFCSASCLAFLFASSLALALSSCFLRIASLFFSIKACLSFEMEGDMSISRATPGGGGELTGEEKGAAAFFPRGGEYGGGSSTSSSYVPLGIMRPFPPPTSTSSSSSSSSSSSTLLFSRLSLACFRDLTSSSICSTSCSWEIPSCISSPPSPPR
mmetsp:Transcript_26137/g.49430  ORF Transcript_26137/g.49430 Transcript_26137/m.49430 type:complete len:220 (-) Transcript_26137:253-912(-)